MPDLKTRIIASIRQNGAMRLDEYMRLCLSDPQQGYYTQEKIFGQKGDFITAPEISQMFGELIGIWCLLRWQELGCPEHFILLEAGPGRGALMADLLRACAIQPDFIISARVFLLENSPALRKQQAHSLQTAIDNRTHITWCDNLNDLPDYPLIFIANEFFDALPIRQFHKNAHGWSETVVQEKEGELIWHQETLSIPPESDRIKTAKTDDIVEISSASHLFMEQISSHIHKSGGAGLVIDYGYGSGFGDTFQAVRNHQYTDPLMEPGKADLTAHVDFCALQQIALSHHLQVENIISQGDFLWAHGLATRAEKLSMGKSPQQIEEINQSVVRLTAAKDMGEQFKVLQFQKYFCAMQNNS